MENKLFCPLRCHSVAATPEEHVRQRLIRLMLERGGYPRSLLAAELSLAALPLPSSELYRGRYPKRRIDLLCFSSPCEETAAGQLLPLLLVECKARPLNEQAVKQLQGYNYFVQARYIALANEASILLGRWEADSARYLFSEGLPSYSALSVAA